MASWIENFSKKSLSHKNSQTNHKKEFLRRKYRRYGYTVPIVVPIVIGTSDRNTMVVYHGGYSTVELYIKIEAVSDTVMRCNRNLPW